MEEINLKTIQDLFKSGSLDLVATQPGVCLPMLQRIYKKMKVGIDFDAIRVNESRIVDGHHRYVCSKLLDMEIEITNNYPIPSTSENHEWEVLVIDEFDHETDAEINEHNVRDAELSGHEIEFLNDL